MVAVGMGRNSSLSEKGEGTVTWDSHVGWIRREDGRRQMLAVDKEGGGLCGRVVCK